MIVRNCGVLALGLTIALAFGGAGGAVAQGCPSTGPVAVGVDGQPATIPSLYENLVAAGVAQGPTSEIDCYYGYEDRNDRHVVIHSPAITVVDDWLPAIQALHEGIGRLGVYVHAIDDWEPGSTGTFSHPHPLDLGQGIQTRGDAAEYITGDESYGIHAKHTGEGRVGIDVRNVSVHTDGDYAHGVYAWQEGSYRLRNNGGSTRARGAVVVNLIETDRDRESRIRPLVRTGGDYADAVRAEYTRAAAYGHVVVNVEGYTIATGGIVPLGVVGIPRQPGATPQEPRRVAVDFSRPYVANANYDPDDPNSPQYYNIRLRDDLQQALYAGRVEDVFQELGLNPIFPGDSDGTGVLSGPIDIRPYTIVYLPVRNPDYDPEAGDSDSNRPYIDSPAATVWNGRYFRALDESLATDVLSCQSMASETARTACIKEKITDKGRGSGAPTGFEARGIYASHEGHGDVRIASTDNVIRTWGADAHGIYATHTGRTVTTPGVGGTTVVTPGGGGVSITVTGGSIGTEGLDAHGVYGRHRGDGGADSADGWVDPDDIGDGDVDIRITDAAIATAGDHASGVYGEIQQTICPDSIASSDASGHLCAGGFYKGTGVGDINIAVTDGAIATGGTAAYAVHARHENEGTIDLRTTGVAVATGGDEAHGVFADHRGSGGGSAVAVTVDGGSVATKGERAHGVHALQSADGGVTVRVVNGATVATEGWGAYGVYTVNSGGGDLTVELDGSIGTKGVPATVSFRDNDDPTKVNLRTLPMASVFVQQNGAGRLAFRMTGGRITAEGDEVHSVQVVRTTAGGGSIDITGGEVRAEGDGTAGVLASFTGGGTGTVSVTVGEGASVTGDQVGIQLSAEADADGNIPTRTVRVDGAVRGGSSAGVYLSAGGSVTIGATGRVGAESGIGVFSDGNRDADVTVAGTVEGDVRKSGSGALRVALSGEGEIDGDVRADDGRLTLDPAAGSTVTGTVHDPGGPLTVRGSVGRLLYSNGGAVTVAATGRLTGVEGEAVRSASGDLSLTVADMGKVTGDVRAVTGGLDVTLAKGSEVEGDVRADDGRLTLDLAAGSTVTGTVHDPDSPLTVRGSIGRLLYSNGGTVTVAAAGRLTGVEGDDGTEAVRSASGDLSLTVADMGKVTGDVRAVTGGLDVTLAKGSEVEGDVRADDGRLTLDLAAGSTVTGTVHDPDSPLTVRGSIGRLLYSNGGTVTVAAAGRLTGVEGDDGTEAVRSAAGDLSLTVADMGTVTGDVRAGGDLTATVSGAVTGDVFGLGSGDHMVTVEEGGTVGGTIRLAAASTVAVGGAARRVWLDNGGTVTVGAAGRLTGVEGDDGIGTIHSATGDLTATISGAVTGDVRAGGDLTATISGTVTGDVLGLGSGDHTVTVEEGGTVGGTIRLAGSTVTVGGAAGRVWLDNGGTVTVSTAGRLTGVEGDDGTEAIRSATGDLSLTVAGMVTGDVLALGTGTHRVTVAEGGDVSGTVRMARAPGSGGSTLTLNGVVNRVRLDRGGALTVGSKGRIRGMDGVAISAPDQFPVHLNIEETPEETSGEKNVTDRLGGRIGGDPQEGSISITPADGSPPLMLGRLGTADAAPRGAYDLGWNENGELQRTLAPRAQVYEALPSVLLGMNRLPEFRDRMAAPRDSKGAWGLLEATGGAWKTAASTTGADYRHRRRGVRVGMDVPAGENVLLGVSAHHGRGTARVSHDLDDLEVSGYGIGVSGSWSRDGVYVDLAAAATSYRSDLKSYVRGELKRDASAFGHALGVEAGRRMVLDYLPGGAVLTPRVGLVHSRISMSDFTDTVGARVSLNDGRSLRARVGASMETEFTGPRDGRVFGSLDVERETSKETKITVSGTELAASGKGTWLRLGVGGTLRGLWHTIRGTANYATGGGGAHEYGAGVELKVWF